MKTKHETCEDRINAQLDSRLEDLRKLWAAYCEGDEEVEDLGSIFDYGLFDYVEPDTLDDQPYGYWRYQLSWGVPSDEFRLYGGGRIEYRFHEWFDGAGRDLTGDDLSFMRDLFAKWFLDSQEDRHGF